MRGAGFQLRGPADWTGVLLFGNNSPKPPTHPTLNLISYYALCETGVDSVLIQKVCGAWVQLRGPAVRAGVLLRQQESEARPEACRRQVQQTLSRLAE